ncbi:MAG: glycine cleavage system protein GcvH [Deltaproteobacteria bacterium]|nr:glycine cleavage system protein GcvH [Deltaproteobacteria bacterium]
MKFPEDLKYTKDHEWGRPEGNRLIAGITDYAQDELGDIVYIELNDKGSPIKQGEVFGTVESVKAVSELYAPASGSIVEINEALLEAPEIVNKDPYGDGWMIVIEMEDRAELDNLMDSQEYRTYVEKEAK